jgi:hypothetical protein
MSADIGREAVYAAEIAAFEGTSFESVTLFAELLDLAALIADAEWWPHGEIAVVPARADAGSSSTRQRAGTAPVIRLAAPQITPATVVHEFAHVLAGVAHGHDDVFRRAHVDLVGYALGDDPAVWLLDGYAAMGLQPGRRSWEAPPVRREAGGPVAL